MEQCVVQGANHLVNLFREGSCLMDSLVPPLGALRRKSLLFAPLLAIVDPEFVDASSLTVRVPYLVRWQQE